MKPDISITPSIGLRWSTPLQWVCSLTVILSGCAIGPNYRRPEVTAPAHFRNAPESNSTASLADLPWWAVFQDSTLTNLIQTALTNNYDLRLALSRVEQSYALTIQARSELLPQIGYEGSAARGKNSLFGSPSPLGLAGQHAGPGDSFLAMFNASWEVDLWGRVRRLNESARAQFLATEEARHGVRLSVIGQVAQAYFELLELDEQLQIARRATNSYGQSLSVFSHRLGAGAASELETSRAESALATATAAVPELERQIAVKENQLSILLGRSPGPVPRNTTLLQQNVPLEIPVGLPSQLLERRPDLRQAEQVMRSANSQVGVAQGDFLPRIGLTALYGGVSSDLSKLTSPGANLWSVAANVSGPAFQGGRLYGQYRQTRAVWEAAKLQYQQIALNAFREVADALITRQKLGQVRDQQARAVAAGKRAVDVSARRYLAGKASYYEVLEAQQQLFPAEYALARTRLSQLLVIVQLYEALGGGWENLEQGFAENSVRGP